MSARPPSISLSAASSPSPRVSLYLFGAPRLEYAGQPVEPDTRKALALLAYLALAGQPQSRETLAALFWPEQDEARSRTSLRRALWSVRQVTHSDFLQSDRQRVSIAPAVELWVDVLEFEQLVTKGEANPVVAIEATAAAATLYQSDFLAGFTLPDAPDFDQWQSFQAERLRQLLEGALQRLIRGYISTAGYTQALVYAQHWLALDPLHESAHRMLMQLYAWTGQYAAALRQYEKCKRLLHDGLQILPDPETQSLYDAIRHQRLSSLPPVSQKTYQETASAAPLSNAPAHQSPTFAAPSFLAKRAATTSVTPFVARERELRELAVALATAQQGEGQILFVIGGAGRGKTTLVQEFARRAQEEYPDLLVASGSCNAYTGSGDPYLPFREILIALTGDVETKWAGGLISTENARRLWEAMPTTLPTLVELAPDLLSAFVPITPVQARVESFAPPDAAWFQQLHLLANEKQRLPIEERQLFAQFTDALTAIAVQSPLLLILEDLHWVDTASNNLLLHLSRMLGQSRILVIGTYRPDELIVNRTPERHPLASIVGELKRQHGDIWLDLGTLSPEEGQAFVHAYLDTQPNRLDTEFRTDLFQHTGGHALFTAELLREMQARGDLYRDPEGFWVVGKRTNWSVLPAKIEGVIEQRIGRLERGLQEILTIASIEGESFTAEVVARARGQAEYELVQQLSQELDRQHRLVVVESLDRVGPQRLSRYRFRHHLFQHYLYHHLTASERAYLHEKVGNTMESLYAERTAPVAVQLAHHFEQAGLAEKAVAYLRQAGEQAYHISANQEAIQLITRALALLTSLPSTQHQTEQELALCVKLGRALQQTRGLGSQEARKVYQRAYELSAQVGNDHDRFAALHGLHSTSGDYSKSLAIAEQMLQLAANQPNGIYQVSAHHLVGHDLMTFGEYTSARSHLEQSIALYEPRDHQEYVLLCGQDEGVAALANLSLAVWHLGYPDQALQRGVEAVVLAEGFSHPISLAIAKHYNIWIHLLRGEAQIAQQKIDALLELGNEQGFSFVSAVANTYRAQAMLLQGQVDAAIRQFEQARVTWRAMKFSWYEPYLLLELVVAHRRIGEFKRGFVLLSEAEAAIEATPEFHLQDIFYRIKGELLFVQAINMAEATTGTVDALQLSEAEAAFMQAIQIARTYQAKTRELQATIGLCRLWMHQGKIETARSVLDEIYHWFTEGFNTADLVDAKALRETLATTSSHTCP